MWRDIVAYVLYLDRPGYRQSLERAEALTLHEDERLRNVASHTARLHGGWYSHAIGDSVVLVLPNASAARCCWSEIRSSFGAPLKGGIAWGQVQQDEQGRACGRVVCRAASMVEDADQPEAGRLYEWKQPV